MIWMQASMHVRYCSLRLVLLFGHEQCTAVLVAACTCHEATHRVGAAEFALCLNPDVSRMEWPERLALYVTVASDIMS